MSKKDVLSEGELDALMESFSDGDAPPGEAPPEKKCEPFDFTAREQNLLAQMPALKNLNEKHALALSQAVRNLYGISVQVDVEEPQLVALQEKLQELSAPTAINIVRMPPLNGLFYILVPPELLSVIVDKYFGGGAAEGGAAAVRKHLTHSERRVNDALAESFLQTLVETWREKIALSGSIESFESNPDFLQVPVPSERVLSFSFVIRINERSCTICWLAPYAALEPLRSKLASASLALQPTEKNTDWERHFLRELQHVELELSGAFASEDVSIADVVGFRTGSIVPLKMPTEVMVMIEGEAFSVGEHGAHNGHKSIKIREMLLGNS